METAREAPILVVGGGIGGATTALALAQAGFPTHVIEKSRAFGEIGAGIQLAPNASRALDRLGLYPAIKQRSVPLHRATMRHTESGRCLTTLDLREPFQARYGYPYLVMHRGDLLDVILDACRQHANVTLEADKEMTHIVEHRDAVTVECSDGTAFRCQAVIAADGVSSRAREWICGDGLVVHGFVAYRGAIRACDVPIAVSPEEEIIWIGPGKHLVQYPIRGGDLYNQVAVFRSKRFGRDASDCEWGTVEELEESFSSACEEVQVSVKMIHRDRFWPMLDRSPVDNWTRGRVTLLGDSAHPMLQYLGQGGCQAIEDASCLAEAMVEAAGDVPRAFSRYQSLRIPRTARVQLTARWWGALWHDEGDVVPALRDRILTTRAADDYTDLDWLYREAV